MYLMMRAIGEMLYMDLINTPLSTITKYLGKGWGYFSEDGPIGPLGIFGNGRSRLFQLCPALVSKLASLADSNCLLALLSCVNLIAVKVFGEVEFGLE